MKNSRHPIRFSILVPLIFAGIGFRSALRTCWATQIDPPLGQEDSGYAYQWALLVWIIVEALQKTEGLQVRGRLNF
jgi:hypothetical protein